NGMSWSFKNGDNEWCPQTIELPDKPFAATAVGGSTLLVKREVLGKLSAPCFKIVYREIDEDGRCFDEAEDEYFSRIAREAGYELMVDPTIVCKHYNYCEI
ncbi:unnamed protein product, partial [marine sediment metagenome]